MLADAALAAQARDLRGDPLDVVAQRVDVVVEGVELGARPNRCTVPVCGISPASARSRVDLPAPLGPTMLVQHPASTGR